MQGIHFGKAPEGDPEGSRGSRTEEGEITAWPLLQPGPTGELRGVSCASEPSAPEVLELDFHAPTLFSHRPRATPGEGNSQVKSSPHGETNELQQTLRALLQKSQRLWVLAAEEQGCWHWGRGSGVTHESGPTNLRRET